MMDMAKLLKQFQKMQEEAKKVQGELVGKEVVGSSGGGMVKVTFNGKFEVVDVEIEKKLFTENDVEMLEELILSAVNDGIKKVQELIKKKVKEFTGGLNIPEIGIPGMFG